MEAVTRHKRVQIIKLLIRGSFMEAMDVAEQLKVFYEKLAVRIAGPDRKNINEEYAYCIAWAAYYDGIYDALAYRVTLQDRRLK